MGRVLVLYYSKDGNTSQMAQHVAEGARRISGIEVRLKGIEEARQEDVAWCDGLALGAPTNLGNIPWRMKRFWDEEALPLFTKIDGKIGCAFSSQGGWGGGAELACQAMMTVMMNFGFLVFGVTDYTGHQFTLHYGATQAGEPRQDREVESCRRLGQRLSEWVAVFFDGRRDQHPLVAGRNRE
ncbi:MAG TPA: flavodoxin family protein [Polyangiaceae bacterium]|jgi:NAD(P)H dehydrogenase (quinone)